MGVVLTSQGKKALEEELEHLKVRTRNEVAEKIRVAREFGDISENAEYDAAKEEQAMIEGRIIELEQTLAAARVIDGKIDTSVVSVGCTVKLLDLEFNDTAEYKIVGSMEADPTLNKISNESPVGAALLGHKKDEVVKVQAPSGVLQFKIIDIVVKKEA